MSCRTCVDVSEVPLGYSIPVACSVVTGDANFTGATIIPELHGKALDACGLKVDCTLTWRLAAAPVGEVDLSCSTLGRLEDDDMSWPPCSSGDGRASRKTRKLKLCGLQYGSLESKNEKSEKDQAKWRLDWLDSAETYSPQPYEELARVYRETGHSDLAQRVMMRPKGIWYAAYTWFAIVFGWASATALVAGLTRLWRT